MARIKRAYLTENSRQNVYARPRAGGRTVFGWAKATGDRSTFYFKPIGGPGRPKVLPRRNYQLSQVA